MRLGGTHECSSLRGGRTTYLEFPCLGMMPKTSPSLPIRLTTDRLTLGKVSGPLSKRAERGFFLVVQLAFQITLFFLTALCASHAGEASPVPHRTEENIPYRSWEAADEETKERCALDVHSPEGGKDLPVIVWFHGGGLTEGKRFLPEELKDQGVVVVTPGYRLSPGVKSPTDVEDAAAAVAWVFANIARYGGSPDKIYLSGASAGGYLAAMVGLDKKYLAAHGIDADKLAGLVPLTGQMVTHFTVRQERGGSNLQPVIDEMAPLYHVRKDAPPILVITGDRELELWGRYEENAYFVRMMRVVGHPDITLYELQGHDHGETTPTGNRLLLRHVKTKCGLLGQEKSS